MVQNGTAGAGSWCRPTESVGCIDLKSFVATEKLDQPTKSDHLDLERQSTLGMSVNIFMATDSDYTDRKSLPDNTLEAR